VTRCFASGVGRFVHLRCMTFGYQQGRYRRQNSSLLAMRVAEVIFCLVVVANERMLPTVRSPFSAKEHGHGTTDSSFQGAMGAICSREWLTPPPYACPATTAGSNGTTETLPMPAALCWFYIGFFDLSRPPLHTPTPHPTHPGPSLLPLEAQFT
jgi:hypothetical protein